MRIVGDRLSSRLFLAQALVVGTGAVTLLIVAVVVTPGLFATHVRRAIGPVPAELARHLDRALASALLVSLGVAIGVGLLTALVASWFITRRLTAPVTQMAAAAARVADGAYDTRVPPSRLGIEFATLDNAFNRMAATLQETERRRRDLLADLAHELRTPIATVDSFLEGVEDGVIPAGPRTWRTMREQTARLRRLVDDVDNLSRAEERQLHLRRESLRVDNVVDEAVRGAGAAFAEKGVRLTHRSGAEPVEAYADRDRLREILDNLLVNAVRHTPAGGEVTVSTTTGDGQVRVSVTDTGDGIAAEHLPHVFDRFYRADRARSRATGGSGIGLTIARALAREHGGDLRAASDGAGSGATFTLILPVAGHPRPEPRDRPGR